MMFFFTTAEGCFGAQQPYSYKSDNKNKYDFGPGISTLTGEGIGTEDYTYKKLWSNNGQDLVCTDDAAVFQISLVRDPNAKLPDLTNIKSMDISPVDYYFRIDIHGLERLADKDKCLIRDASDDRVWNIVEGSYDPKNDKFTLLACSKDGVPDSANIHFDGSGKFISGEITCAQGSRVFKFSNIEIK
jgi:hypothetical protein